MLSDIDEGYMRLYNKDGKPIIILILTKEGIKAYKQGEKIDFFKGHFSCVLDVRSLNKLCL